MIAVAGLDLEQIAIGLIVGLAVNVTATMFLCVDRQPPSALGVTLVRWLGNFGAFVTLAFATRSVWSVITLVPLAVSSATDLESRRVPPDAFTYGSAVMLLAAALVFGGPEAFRDMAVAQVIAFATGIFLATFGVMAGGDVKLLMQWGCACGALPVLFASFLVQTGLRVVVMSALFIGGLCRLPAREAFRAAGRHRSPHGPFAFASIVIALCLFGIWIP